MNKPPSSALAHFRVLDLTRVRAGPTCVKQLADFGADVIKIELPPAVEIDSMNGPRHGFDMQNLHRNKRSMTLNLKQAQGVAIFMQLVERADVVVENFRPDVKHRLGIGYEALRKVNPRVVLAPHDGHRRAGARPDARRDGGRRSRRRAVRGAWHPDRAARAQPIRRRPNGCCNLLQAQIGLMDFQAARYLMTGEVPPQVGNDHPHSMPTSAYPTKDGYINIGASGNAIWARFCKATGHEDWLGLPDFADEPARAKHRAKLNAAGVPSGPIYTMDQVFADPQVRHLQAAATVRHPQLGDIRIVDQVVKLSRTPASMACPAPELGAHTGEILAELDYDESQIAARRSRNIV
jgi:crotonobetainyl-CoA:carnitine CoA-transferase CaiB-like acyl-CoA transferase